eukprot:TRINITY_DN686_c0_g2_i2.p1 TRINITY_DN686_c0_g2~~TRINITY_DN686_c0_g2_i2.p1  ORF type:complete len:238 (-),score=47.76 TRINITY_DN686_c0_g2_i2:17-730(-)
MDMLQSNPENKDQNKDPGISLENSGQIDLVTLDATSDTTDGQIDWGKFDVVGGDITTQIQDAEEHKLKDNETVLGDTQARNELLQALLEMEAFYTQRLLEFNEDQSFIISFSNAPEIIKKYNNKNDVEIMLSAINSIVTYLQQDRVRLILDIKSSKRFLERLCDSIRQKQVMITNMETSVMREQNRRKEIAQNISQEGPKVNKLIDEVFYLKGKVEKDLSKMLDRVVSIIGEINKIK